MAEKPKHIKLHSASMITLRALQHYLDQENIQSIIKSNFELGVSAGFATHINDNNLYVLKEDYHKAIEILKMF